MSGMRKKQLHSASVNIWFLISMFSYLLIAVLLLTIVGIPVYRTIRGLGRTQVMDAVQRNLASLSGTMDELCFEMDRTTYLMQSNGKMLPEVLQRDAYYAWQAHRDLKQVCLISNLINDVAVVYAPRLFQGEQKTYAGQGTWSTRLFFEYAYRYDQWSLAELNQQLASYTSARMRPMEWVSVNNSERAQYMTYITPMSHMGANTRGVMLFLLGKDGMDAMLARVNLPEGVTLQMRDSDGITLYASGPAEQEMTTLDPDCPPKGRMVRMSDVVYTQLSETSAYNGWVYQVLIPEAYIAAAVQRDAGNVLLYLGIGLVCAMVLSMVLTMQSSKPVRRLTHIAQRLVPEQTAPEQPYRNAFDLIEESMSQLEQKNTRLSDRLRSQHGMMRIHLLRKLYYEKGEETETLRNLLAEDHIRLTGAKFRVLVFRIDDAQSFEHRLDASMRDLTRFGLVEAVQEISRSRGLIGIGCEF
ncbi:MAG: hypothetical protein RR482_08295, partial [Clostridia bacterium]